MDKLVTPMPGRAEDPAKAVSPDGSPNNRDGGAGGTPLLRLRFGGHGNVFVLRRLLLAGVIRLGI
jgi:hypothetical protein